MNKILLTLFLLLLPIGTLTGAVIKIENPLEAESFEALVNNLIDFIFNISIVIVPLMIIVGGLLFVTAAGNISQIEQAKKLITWTVVGFIIVLLAKGLVNLLQEILEVE